MEQMRITLKIEGGDKEFKISGNISKNKALEYFEMLYSDLKILEKFENNLQNTDICEQNTSRCITEGEKEEKEEREETQRKTLYSRVLDLIKEKGPISTKEIAEKFEKDKTLISAYVSKLKAEGKIVNTQGSKRLYISANFKARATQEYGTFEKLIKYERTEYIIDYILSKSEVKVDDIKTYVSRRNTYDVELIADIIKVLDEYDLICWDNGKEGYIIPDTTKIWYYALKEDPGITFMDLYQKPDVIVNSEEFIKKLEEAREKGLIEIKEDYIYAILK